MCKISVIICCYNSEPYIGATLNSLKEQSFPDYEVIIINDGSTDNTLKIIDEFAPDFPEIRVINQPNLGLNESRNIGLGLTNPDSKYVVFFDSDDLFSNDLLHCLHEEISLDNSAVAVFSRYLKFDDFNNYSPPGFGGFFLVKNFHPINSERKNYFYFDILSGIVPAIEPACIYKKDTLLDIGGWDSKNFPKGETNGELIPLLLSLKKRGGIKYTDKGCYFYRQHSQQITQKISFDSKRADRIKNELYYIDITPVNRLAIKLFLMSFINLISIKGSFKHIMRYEFSKIPSLFVNYFKNLLIVFILTILKGRTIKRKLFV